MPRAILIIYILVFVGCTQDRYQHDLPRIKAENLKFSPEYYTLEPGIHSPVLSETNRELVLLEINTGRYSWFDATVENGAPFDYKRNLYGKGNQLLADKEDFPRLARRGIHAESDLRSTKTITGRSVSRITVDGRPLGSSGVGFMAEDETIMSVIHADNQTVKRLSLTHPDIARPLFHVWNTSREFEKFNINSVTGERLELSAMIYNGYRITMNIAGSRGWQESIFNDEILGTGHMELSREMDPEEGEFLEKNYAHLPQEKLRKLQEMLFNIRTGEMVLFYINRYGFYEGHTEYRVDPIAVALVFGLKSIKDVHEACGRDLYHYFTTHFTRNPE